MSTCIIYGFARLSTASTLWLAVFNVSIRCGLAKGLWGRRAKMMQRLIVHLAAVNGICYALYRLINLH
jgi:hypothetical protein